MEKDSFWGLFLVIFYTAFMLALKVNTVILVRISSQK